MAATLGLSMIVKNEAHTLRPCLESVRGVVSQIVIADTGSTDNTIEVAHEFGAEVLSVPWENHFAKARNAALAPITTDWVLVLDADEELDAQAETVLPELLAKSDVAGYATPIRNYILSRSGRTWNRAAAPNDGRHHRADKAPAFIVHEYCRLFRRHPGIYFRGRIHEAVEKQIAATGGKLQAANFCIHHFGHMANRERRDEKNVFYCGLLRSKVEDDPNDPMAWVQLGLQEFEFSQNPEEALRCMQRSLELRPSPEAWLFTAMICVSLGRYQEALAASEHVTGSSSAALREHFRGDALHNLGQLPEAQLSYQRALKLTGDDPQLESKLGYTEVRMGLKDSGLARLRHAAGTVPKLMEVHDRLIKAYIVAGLLPEAAEAAEEFTTLFAFPRAYLRAASIRAKLNQLDRSAGLLARGLELFPDSPELRNASGEVNRSR